MKSNTKKPHVMHLIGSSGFYGAERWILALLGASDPKKVISTVVNLMDIKDGTSEVIGTARSRGLNAFEFYTAGAYNPWAIFRLATFVRKNDVDIIHSHGYKSDIIGLFSSRLAGRKVITTPHGWSFESDKKLQFYEWLDRVSFRFMDKVCPLSPDLERGIKGRLRGNNLKMILNGVDVEEVRSFIPAPKASNVYTVGYIGQLIDRKDLKTLLKAISIIKKNNRKINLKIVGDGPQKRTLQEEASRLSISKYVEFFGFRADALSLLKSFDLFVLPSLMEGIPRCIMEAMAAGVPVAVSDIPGNRDLVTAGENGCLFSPGDSVGLAKTIQFFMDSPEVAKDMAIRGLHKIDEQYSNQRMAKEYEALYLELMEC